MPRRLYLPSAGAAGQPSLAYGTGWNRTTAAARFAGTRTPLGTPNASRSVTSTVTSPEFHCCAQFQYPGLAAQTISGTLKGQIRGAVNNVSFNGTVAIAARVVSSTGTLRGYLLGPTPAAPPQGPTPPELTGTATNRSFRDSAGSAVLTLTPVDAQLDDVLVVEVGLKDEDTGTSRSGDLRLQDVIAAVDLPENETATSANNPWVEFSGTIVFTAETIPITATAAATFGAMTLEATATVGGALPAVSAALATTFGAMTLASTATVTGAMAAVSATVATTFANMGVSATVTVPARAALALTFADMTMAASAFQEATWQPVSRIGSGAYGTTGGGSATDSTLGEVPTTYEE